MGSRAKGGSPRTVYGGRRDWVCRAGAPYAAHACPHSLCREKPEEETVPCAGEMLEGFLEESLAGSVKAGSDLDRAQEGGDTCRGRGNLDVGIAWKLAPLLSMTAFQGGCEPIAGTQLCSV